MKRVITHTALVLSLLALTVLFNVGAQAQRPVRGSRVLSPRPMVRPIRSAFIYPRPPAYRYRGYYTPVYSSFHYYRPWLGIRFRSLPWGYVSVHYGPDIFYYSDGLFYRNYNDYYEVVAPPVGAEVPSLPPGAKEVRINGQVYYEKNGVYYREVSTESDKKKYIVEGKDGELNTEATPVHEGDMADELPQGSRKVIINGLDYYLAPNGCYYQETMDGDKKAYRVVGSTEER